MPTEENIDTRLKVARILKEARELRGISIQELADAVGYSKNTITRIEEGKFSPGADQLYLICEKIGIKITINNTQI